MDTACTGRLGGRALTLADAMVVVMAAVVMDAPIARITAAPATGEARHG